MGEMRADIRDLEENGATKADLNSPRADLSSDMNSLRADVASDLVVMRKELGEQIVGLRRAVIDYHTSVIGHGILISEPEEPIRRVEQQLNMPPLRTM